MLEQNFWDKPDLLITTGSRLYGCSDDSSDFDLKGFVIPPAPYLLGRKQFNQIEEKSQEKDITIWGVNRFFELLSKGSPNTFEILFAPEEFIVCETKVGRMLLDNRHLFMGINQLSPLIGYSENEWSKALLLKKDKSDSPGVCKRKQEDFRKYGYSRKNAYHAIRLLHQGIELAENQHISFPRPEVELLIKIRKGEIFVEDLTLLFETLHAKFRDLVNSSDLPQNPYSKRIDQLYYDMVNEPIVAFLEKQSANTIS